MAVNTSPLADGVPETGEAAYKKAMHAADAAKWQPPPGYVFPDYDTVIISPSFQHPPKQIRVLSPLEVREAKIKQKDFPWRYKEKRPWQVSRKRSPNSKPQFLD